MIQQGKDTYKPALKEMWKLCFPKDATEFIDFYFNEIYINDETLVCIENNQPVASLQMIPYSLKTGTVISTAGYISGAMTHPDFQKKGYMQRLLNAAFNAMQAKGYDYTFLIPQEKWLFDFYGKYGYVPAFPKYEERVFLPLNPLEGTLKVCTSIREATKSPLVYATYSRFLSAMPRVVLKSKSQFDHVLWDFFNEKGVLFANDYGIAFTLQKEEAVVVKEFFYRDEETKQVFLESISQHYSSAKIIIRQDPDAPVCGYKGMIKSLNLSMEAVKDIYMNLMLD